MVVDSFVFNDSFVVTEDVKRRYDEDGFIAFESPGEIGNFIVLRDLFSAEEITKLTDFFTSDPATLKNAHGRADGAGRITKLSLWNHHGDDIAGTVPRMHKMAGTMEKLMGGFEVYHFHSKLMMKDAEVGGQHVWHQDFGYWYKSGLLFPYAASVFIALDKCTTENACLQVLKGSHLAGKIDHGLVGNEDGQDVKQQGADLMRVEMLKSVCPLIPVELNAGDAIFLDSNLLHCSGQNYSKKRRWALIVAYNQARNNPVIEGHCPMYTKLGILPNDALLSCENKTSSIDKEFMDPLNDISVHPDKQ